MNLGIQGSFFMPKFRHKEMVPVLKDNVLEIIFADREIKKIPLGAQSTAVNTIERILEQIKEGNPYASLSELFDADE